MNRNVALERVLTAAPVVPVLTIEDAGIAVPLATALVKGGLPAIEITLRTAAAIDAVRAVANEVEGAFAGVGTVLDATQLKQAADAGATFAVSPGTSRGLLDAAADSPVPLLPGAATVSEAMALSERGYEILKFFPAEPAGGVAYLKALAAPLPAIRFCPTGGISLQNAPDYLKLENVICVGGSWIAPQNAIAAGDWQHIKELARQAAGLNPAKQGRDR
ncbi:MAG TPA: bifunctional 4-hydroxy-2-oxoglutarate aldolase/2-dehydro-3-deoxy-phosphogluconate aldolase [Afifellaceae bacterium]|nr:bifunctional 4-hydroxy-2-oxoglutarate aldolase/2-dehydro-3-deoxy-phosphogluconate aldolase [Afifellaceae bacterium]